MDFFTIIQIIMSIITLIMQMIGGGMFSHTLVADQDRPIYLAAQQWQCGQTYWQTAPSVKHNLFSGTVALDCEVEGTQGGGLVEARRHLINELPLAVSTVAAGPYIHNFEGLPSIAFDVAVRVQTATESAALEGRTDIATDGFTRLRSVFTSTRTPSEGSAKYLKQVVDEVDITPGSRAGWYKVTMRYTSQIERPWMIGTRSFQEQVVKKQEEKMQERKVHVLNELSNHL